MVWSEVFIVFVLCHLVGDYVVQTDWQARWKDQQVTLKDVGQGSITLPPHAFYKKP